jgi:uncharacterized protein (DUF2147 family)
MMVATVVDPMETFMRITLIATCLLAVASIPALAADPRGTWFTEEQQSQVRIGECGGTIVALKEPLDPKTGRPWTDEHNPDPGKRNRPLIGVEVVLGMKPAGADKRAGQLYNASDGKTYSGNLTMIGGNTIKVQGCVMGGLVCKTQTWTRSN